MTVKKTTTAPSDASAEATAPTETQTEHTPAIPAPTVVGPAPAHGAKPQTVVLSHHLRIGGADYAPGDEILVSPDYARRLRAQGYTART